MQEAGGRGVAKVGILSAASSDPPGSGEAYREVFASVGAAETYWIPVHEDDIDAAFDEEVAAKVRDMTLIFMSGGDQARIVNSLYYEDDNGERASTPVLDAIKSVYEGGSAVLAGDSAGAAVMPAGPMMLGGYSYNALLNGANPVEPEDPDDLWYDPLGGLGLVPELLIDTHFTQRGREGRLARLVWDTRDQPRGVELGIGVDEDTALLIIYSLDGSNPQGEVLGRNGVFLVDVSRASAFEIDGQFAIRALYTHYLR